MQKPKDALALLKSDHQKVSKLFAQAEKNEAEKEGIFAEINAALTVHATIEEEIFYPTVKKAKSEQAKDEVLEALAEHKQIKALLAELSGMSGEDESFAMKLKVLKEDVEHHVEEEQNEMFPDAKKYLGEKRLVELGADLDRRKRELMGEMDMGMEEGDESEMSEKSANGNGNGSASKSHDAKSLSKSQHSNSGAKSHSSHKA
jgi:hemerythrin superfamily protein